MGITVGKALEKIDNMLCLVPSYFPLSRISKRARYQAHIVGFADLPELDILWHCH
jgi:hypothetical protein